MGRMSSNGLPLDMTAITRLNKTLTQLLPHTLVNWAAERSLNQKYDHRLYSLQPKHRSDLESFYNSLGFDTKMSF